MPLNRIFNALEQEHALPLEERDLLLDIHAVTHETRGEVKALSKRVDRLEDRGEPQRSSIVRELVLAMAPAKEWVICLTVIFLALKGLLSPDDAKTALSGIVDLGK